MLLMYNAIHVPYHKLSLTVYC